jgi:quinol-cytochrome oxidoreductase complex cytochrome b subunit
MTTPSLCGSFLSSKQSLVAFIWTATTILTLMAFVMAIIMTVQINMQYQHLASMYAMDDDNNQEGEGEEEEHGSQDRNKDSLLYSLMATTSSRSMTFVAVYTMALAVVLNLYGSTAIVGFTSLRGDYIAPCFSSEHSSMKVGIFGGAIVIFANLLLLCAVVLGEFRVEDYRDDKEREAYAPYAVERIATVLAVTCMFLSVLYTTFAVLLFLTHASEEDDSIDLEETEYHSKPLVTISDRTPGEAFLTMDESRSS